jgi:hypothetical protein
MYASTLDYLKALRGGDYLRFAELLDFVLEHYTGDKMELTTPVLLELIAKQLVAAGIKQEDASLFMIAYNLSIEPEFKQIIPSKVRFSLTTLTGALAIALAYQEKKQDNHEEKSFEDLSESEITNQLSKLSSNLPKQLKATFEDAKKKLSNFSNDCELIDKYFKLLTTRKSEYTINDKLFMQRLQILEKLQSYLNEQSTYHQQALMRVKTDIQRLKASSPDEWEYKYLDKVSIEDDLSQVARESARIGLGVLSMLFSFGSSTPPSNPSDQENKNSANLI